VNKFSILSHIKTNQPTNSFYAENQMIVFKKRWFDKKIKKISMINLVYFINYFTFVLSLKDAKVSFFPSC
jgi:hypothetical protein